jgi:hypothetical protein
LKSGYIEAFKKMQKRPSRDMDILEAARLRDEMFKMQKELAGMKA